MASCEAVNTVFEKFKANADKCAAWDKKPFAAEDADGLARILKARSDELRVLYAENNALIDEAIHMLGELDEASASSFFTNIISLPPDKYDDPGMLLTLINGLLAYYEDKNDVQACILLNNRRAWETTAMLRLGGSKEDYDALESYTAVLKYRSEYEKIASADVRAKFMVAYYNIVVVMPTIDVITVEESYRWYKEMLAFYESEPVQRLDGNNERFINLMRGAKQSWLAVECRISKQSDEIKRAFSQLAYEAYADEKKQTAITGEPINADVLLSYEHARVLNGETDWDEAIHTVLTYYRQRIADAKLRKEQREETPAFEIDEEFYLHTRIPDALIYQWLGEPGVHVPMRSRIRSELIRDKMEFLDSIPSNLYSPFINETFANWGFGSFTYLETPLEKETHLFHLVVQRHINTYIHSLMVQKLALRLFESVWADDPMRFTGVLGYREKKDILRYKSTIEEFVKSSAIFHDIGKNRIAGIINIQTRKLTDAEFSIIKTHPETGAQVLGEDIDFARYMDIIRGHHRFYDGTGGYPESFDNTASSVRFVIDMITVCDCLDAATDTLGRNYSSAKGFSEVMEELKKDAAIRYNPYIVKLIDRDKQLYSAMEQLTGTGRNEVCFDVYRMYRDA